MAKTNGTVLVRHLVSIRLNEISPVSVPAYPQTGTALRHLARQVGEDPDDIFALARDNELRKLFPDHAPPVVVDLAPPVPTPATALRTVEEPKVLDPRRCKLELERSKIELDTPRLTPGQALVKLRSRQIDWEETGIDESELVRRVAQRISNQRARLRLAARKPDEARSYESWDPRGAA